MEVLKAIHGALKAALLFCKKFVTDIKSISFEINPHNPCVANKLIDGKQITICWHIDDVKASHLNSKVIDDFVDWP